MSRRFPLTVALGALLMLAGADYASAHAQVWIGRQPTYSYYYPTTSYTVVRPYRNRGILPGFARTGGIGTTPFLGNSMGLGAYSTNYSAPAQIYTYPYPVYSNQMYVYPARVRRWGW